MESPSPHAACGDDPRGARVRITLAQTDATLGDVDGNLKRAERVVAEAADAGSDLVVFPELALSGYQVGDVPHDLSMAPDDPRLLRISQRAGGAGVLVGFPEAGGHGLHTYNSAGYYEDGTARPHPPQALPADLLDVRGAQALPARAALAGLRREGRAAPGGHAHLQRRLAARRSPSCRPRTARTSCSSRPTRRSRCRPSATTPRSTGATSPRSTAASTSSSWCS